jgi:hypothetical protein
MPSAVHWTPQQLALLKTCSKLSKQRPALERSTHIAVADMLHKLAWPEWYWQHVPSGELRTPETGRLLKRMGHRPGMPDFLLIDRDGCHYYLELKRGNASLNPAQIAFMEMCRKRDIPHAVARSFAEAEAQLRLWGVLRPEAR